MSKRVQHFFFLVILFVGAAISACYFEDYYRRLVRYFFTAATKGNITFVGKNFHFFPSEIIVIGFGFFCLLVYKVLNKKKLMNILIVLGLFFISTYTICYIDSNLRIIGCTACNDGKLKIQYKAINYDFIFMTSLLLSISPFLFKFIRDFKVKR